MFFANTAASRSANCAVGGQELLVLASTTAAQSPNAQTPGWPGTASVVSTIKAPRLSFSKGSDLLRGFGAVPAVHTNVSAGISASLRTTTPGHRSAGYSGGIRRHVLPCDSAHNDQAIRSIQAECGHVNEPAQPARPHAADWDSRRECRARNR